MSEQKNILDEGKVKEIAELFATKDITSPSYLEAPQLVNIFNSLGFKDSYSLLEGKGIIAPDLAESLSRISYTVARLNEMNERSKLPEAVQKMIDSTKSVCEALESVNQITKNTGMAFTSQWATPVSDETGLPIQPIQVKGDIQSKHEDSKLSDKEQLAQAEKERELEVLGPIPDEVPVVFISYSWDSEEHKQWVLDFAKDLAEAGIFVLLDRYLVSGVSIVDFMTYGIPRADKVLIIGTTNYKLKSATNRGGVAYEDAIIRSSIYLDVTTNKYVPCLKEGDFNTVSPLY